MAGADYGLKKVIPAYTFKPLPKWWFPILVK